MAIDSGFDMIGGQTRYGAFTDFLGISGAIVSGVNTHDFITGVIENSGTSDTKVAQEGGVWQMVTGTSDGNRCLAYGDSNYKVSNGPIIMEARVQLAALTNVKLFVGFGDLNTINQPITIDTGTTLSIDATANAVGFVFSSAATDATHYYVAGANASTGVGPTLTNFAPVAAKWHTLRVEVAPTGTAYFFANGNQVGMANLATAGGQTGMLSAIATTALVAPQIAIETHTTAAKTALIDYVYVQGGRNTA